MSQYEPHVEHFVRYSDYQWFLSETSDLHGAVHLPAIDCTLDLAEVYARAFPHQSLE